MFGSCTVLGAYVENKRTIECYRETKRNINEIFYEVYLELEKPIDNIFNSFMHCNHVVNQKIAERLFRDIEKRISRLLSMRTESRWFEEVRQIWIR